MQKTTSQIISKERTSWLITGSNVIAAVGRMEVSLEEAKAKYGAKAAFVTQRTQDLNSVIEFYNKTEHYEEYLRNIIMMQRLHLATLKVMTDKFYQLLTLNKEEGFEEFTKILKQEIESIDKSLEQ